MTTRLNENPNITLFNHQHYMELPVVNSCLSEPYLVRLKQTFDKALSTHPRTWVIRFDLRIPQWMDAMDTAVISRFLASIKSQIEADQERKAREGIRVYPCTIRYAWAREQNLSLHWHYHVALFLNADAYRYLGDITANEGNTAARIKKAWASALGVDINQVNGLVEFVRDFLLDSNDPWLAARSLDECFKACSYLTKVVSKQYGNGTKNFSCSNI